MALPVEVERITLQEESWKVLRSGRIDEIHFDTGRIIYRVKIWDAGREAFVTETFNDEGPAYNFLEKVRDENIRDSRASLR
jgi:hypothetical protein